jgi:N-acetylglucosaminyl-diphospho-decaprenol L-rhamnosyltransferase
MTRIEAVVVDHDAGEVLERCVTSLRKAGASRVVIVDNAVPPGSSRRSLGTGEDLQDHAPLGDGAVGASREVEVLETGVNLGYGSGANRGAALCDADLLVICNADVVVDKDSLRHLSDAFDDDPTLAIEGAGHAIAGRLMPHNRFSRRYRMTEMSATETTAVDWVSGSCMLVRRKAFEELGGFDESYFMYGEDVDLCWRAHRAGYGVTWVPSASVTHVGGISTRRTPYRMLAAHHRSALRFAS